MVARSVLVYDLIWHNWEIMADRGFFKYYTLLVCVSAYSVFLLRWFMCLTIISCKLE